MSNERHSAATATERAPSIEQLRMLVPAYVLGALDAGERAWFERGLATPAIARVLQGEIDVHKASMAALAAARVEQRPVSTATATIAPSRPAVRIDTSAYRDDASDEAERPKRPTPMYGTAYRTDEWEPVEVSRANGRTYKPAKARRSREERHAERADRATPRSVRVQPVVEAPRRSAPPAAPAPIIPPAAASASPSPDEALDLPSMEAAVDDLFSDAWSTPTSRQPVLPSGTATAIPHEPVIRRGRGPQGGASPDAPTKGRAAARRNAPVDGLDAEGLDDRIDEAPERHLDPRARRNARGTPWAMLTLGAVAAGAIALAAWQGIRAARLQDRLLLQPALEAVGSGAPQATPTPTPSAAPVAAPVAASASAGSDAPSTTSSVATEAPTATATTDRGAATAAPASAAVPASAPAATTDAAGDRLASLFDAKRRVYVVDLLTTRAGGSAGAQLFWNLERGSGVVHAFGLAPLAADRSYTLWMLLNGEPVPVARFRPTAQGTALIPQVPMPTSVTNVASFAVSEEPYGGSPRPTAVPLLVGDLPRSGTARAAR